MPSNLHHVGHGAENTVTSLDASSVAACLEGTRMRAEARFERIWADHDSINAAAEAEKVRGTQSRVQ